MNSAITPPFLFSPHVRCQYVSLPVATHPGTSKNLGQYSENYMSSTPRSGVENSFIALDIVPMETRLLGVYTVSEAFPEDRYSGMGALIPTETLQVVHISTAIHRSTVARARSEDALASVDTGDGPSGSRAEPGWAEIGFLRGYPSRLDTQSGWMPARMSVTMACRGIPKSPHAISARARGRREPPDRVILAAEPALDLGEEAWPEVVREVHRDPSREGDGFRSILRFGIGRLHTACAFRTS